MAKNLNEDGRPLDKGDKAAANVRSAVEALNSALTDAAARGLSAAIVIDEKKHSQTRAPLYTVAVSLSKPA